jgi:hypothetical protein
LCLCFSLLSVVGFCYRVGGQILSPCLKRYLWILSRLSLVSLNACDNLHFIFILQSDFGSRVGFVRLCFWCVFACYAFGSSTGLVRLSLFYHLCVSILLLYYPFRVEFTLLCGCWVRLMSPQLVCSPFILYIYIFLWLKKKTSSRPILVTLRVYMFLVTNFQSYSLMKKLFVIYKFIQLQFYLSSCILLNPKFYTKIYWKNAI